MEVQVDFLGKVAALKLVPVWHLFSQAGFYTVSQFVILKVGHYLHMLFEQTVHFCTNSPFLHKHTLHDLPSFESLLGLAMSRLGGVISTQIVQY